MKSLLLLFSVLFYVIVARPGDSEKHISEKQKEKVAKSLGVDLEQRKAHLRKLNRAAEKLQEKEGNQQREAGEDLKKKIVPVKIEANHTDLFDVNKEEGVDEYLYEGDINLTEEQLEDMEKAVGENNSTRKKRQLTAIYNKWTGGNVYYWLDSSLSSRKRASIAAAMEYISSRTCIKFIYSTSATNRIKVFNGAGCYSNVGMLGGEQTLSIGNGCEVIGTVAHEFTHALGSWHMQSRSDRDYYVTIDLSTVQSGTQYNFQKLAASQTVEYTPYEYGSFMHYGATAFVVTSNGMSIIPRDTSYVYTMGNRQISFYDIMFLNKHYGCDARCTSSNQCQNGGYPNPNDCSKCVCPSGYGGSTCNQRPSGCGSTLSASTSWQQKTLNIGTSGKGVQDTYNTCTDWITAPQGTSIQVKIISMSNSQCSYGCSYNGIEIKTKAETKVVNPRICCSEFANTVYTSQLNPTPVNTYNRYDASSFVIQYRYVGSPTGSTTTTSSQTTTAATTTGSTGTCGNKHGDFNCNSLKSSGFCTPGTYSIDIIKYNCAEACGLCGKAKSPCKDVYSGCSSLKSAGWCTSSDPLLAEYHCASTCGFCSNPT